MPTTVKIEFTLGRYHATRWDGGANTSDAEWPPSPWRVLRALVATWYARWPDAPSSDIDALLSRLGSPSAYYTPAARPGSSRHYMPDLKHTRAETGQTDQVIDAFLGVGRDDPLLIHWDADISDDQRAMLSKLVELLPYLGRSESLCRAELLPEAKQPDSSWWRLGEVGPDVRQVQLLAPSGAVERRLLEQTTVQVRRARRLLPEGSRLVVYGRTEAAQSAPAPSRPLPRVAAIRFQLAGAATVRARNAVAAADAMHGLISRIITGPDSTVDPVEALATLGKSADGSLRPGPHEHLHVLALPAHIDARPGTRIRANSDVQSVVLWSPREFAGDVAARIVEQARHVRVREQLADHVPPQALMFAASGELDQVYPGLVGPALEWTSWFPYLPVRYRKPKQTDEDHLFDDVTRECRFRQLADPVVVTRVDPASLSEQAGEIAQFRRCRNRETMAQRRRGVHLRLRFGEPIAGPIVIGQLSHFGYGIFLPFA